MRDEPFNTPPSFNAGVPLSATCHRVCKKQRTLRNPEEQGHCSVSHLLSNVVLTISGRS